MPIKSSTQFTQQPATKSAPIGFRNTISYAVSRIKTTRKVCSPYQSIECKHLNRQPEAHLVQVTVPDRLKPPYDYAIYG